MLKQNDLKFKNKRKCMLYFVLRKEKYLFFLKMTPICFLILFHILLHRQNRSNCYGFASFVIDLNKLMGIAFGDIFIVVFWG